MLQHEGELFVHRSEIFQTTHYTHAQAHMHVYTHAHSKTYPSYIAKKGNRNAYTQILIPPITLGLPAPPIRSMCHINGHSQTSHKHSLISVKYNLFTESLREAPLSWGLLLQGPEQPAAWLSVVGYLECHKALSCMKGSFLALEPLWLEQDPLKQKLWPQPTAAEGG